MPFVNNQTAPDSLNGPPQGILEPPTSEGDTAMPITVIGIKYQGSNEAHTLAFGSDVGMILDVGFVAENMEAIDNLNYWGFISVREDKFHLMLPPPSVGPLITGLGTGCMIKQSGANEPFGFSNAKSAHMRLVDTQSDAQEPHDGAQHLHALLRQVTSLTEASGIICKGITEKLAKSMMMAIEDIDPSKWVNSYGVDSLVAVELRNRILREIESDMGAFDILGSVPIIVLSRNIAEKSGSLSAAVLEGAEA